MKMLISIVFIRVQLRPQVAIGLLDFLVFLMLFAAECANVHADGEYYCESLDMLTGPRARPLRTLRIGGVRYGVAGPM